MKVKEQNVPVLRFPGFCGEWIKRIISDFAKVTTGNKDTQNKIDNGGYPFFVRSQNIERINSYSYNGEAILTSGDGVGVGKNFHYIVGKFDFHQRVYCIYGFSKDVCGFFIFQYFSEHFYKRVMRLSAKNSVDSVRMAMITEMPIRLPSLKEQQKIATFLTGVDSKIKQLSKKKALLEQYKKGMMQKLFSQELRFKDEQGNEFPEWEEKRLGEIATFSKGKGISKADISRDGVLECIRYGQLYTDYTETISNVKSRTNIPAKKAVLSEPNDIIIPASGETQIDIATASCVLKGGVALGGDLNIIKTKYDGVFLSYYLNSNKKYDIARLAQGISVVHLYAAQLKLLLLNLPSIPEQRKIATFLSSIDKKINLISTELNHAQAFKKALLQQMFI